MGITKTTITRTVNSDGMVEFEGGIQGQTPPIPPDGTPMNSKFTDLDTLKFWYVFTIPPS